MSDLYSNIAAEVAYYRNLCSQYGEEIVYRKDYYGNNVPDIFSEHFEELQKRHKKETN